MTTPAIRTITASDHICLNRARDVSSGGAVSEMIGNHQIRDVFDLGSGHPGDGWAHEVVRGQITQARPGTRAVRLAAARIVPLASAVVPLAASEGPA